MVRGGRDLSALNFNLGLSISGIQIETMAAKRLALVFPGQGSQRVGMGKDLLENWPRIVGPVLEEASEAVQQNLQRLLFDGPQELLTQTQWTQPAILTHSIAVLRVLQSERELPPADFVLGHSLGEYSALVAANALSFASAAQLVVCGPVWI